MIIRLVREYDDFEPVILGKVVPTDGLLSDDDAKTKIQDAWEEFKDTHPDTDGQFGEFLAATGEWVEIPDTDVDVILE